MFRKNTWISPPTRPANKMQKLIMGMFHRSLLSKISPKALNMHKFCPAKVAVDQTSRTIGALSQFFSVNDLGEISLIILLGN